MTLNLAHPKGVQLAKDLVGLSDVVIENFAPGVIERLGLAYEDLRLANPDIIMLSSAGLGHWGPDTDQVAYGTLIQCFTGWSASQGFPGRDPEIGGIWTDPVVGMMQVFLISAALHRRWEQGEGQYMDLSMAEATTMLLPEAILNYSMNGRDQERLGNRHPSYAPHGNYPCQGDDQWIGITAASDQEWEALCQALGLASLLSDSRFSDALQRWRHRDALDSILATATQNLDAMELMSKLQQAGVPAGASLAVDQLWANPQLRERGFFQSFKGNDGSSRELPVTPWRFDGATEAKMIPPAIARPAQLLFP